MAECREHKIISDVAIFVDDRVLLVRYQDTKKYDGEAGWFLPDDFVRRGEHPAEAGLRILEEQIGIKADHVALSHIESFTGGPDDAWHIVFHFVAGAASEPRLRSSKALAKAIGRRARLGVLPGGHGFFVEQADLFNRTVLRFLEAVRSK